jgi:hypothetical protein
MRLPLVLPAVSSGLIALLAFVVLLGEIDFFATLNWRFRKSVKLDGKIRKPGLFAQPPTGLR